MLYDFLVKNEQEILATTELKTLELAENRPSSDQLKQGLPIFFKQLLGILLLRRPAISKPADDKKSAAKAAADSDEPARTRAAGAPEEAELAKAAGQHGMELLRLGYTLSHVVHAYGALCQTITEVTTKKKFPISTSEFHDLNQCLDVAIAGAVTTFQTIRNTQVSDEEVKHLGFLAHEMRNALTSANISYQLIKRGTVGTGGSTGQVLEQSLKRAEELIDRALTEVRLRVDPVVRVESGHLLQLVDQILATAQVEAQAKNQKIVVEVDPTLVVEADQQAFHSAIANLIQNAIKFTHDGGKIQVRGNIIGEQVVIEVEDECGGLLNHSAAELFKPFVQKNSNRSGLGLGLTIAQRAIEMNHGKIEARNLRGKGCVFTITLPSKTAQENLKAKPAA